MPQENISYTCTVETDDGLCHTELTKRKHGQFTRNPRGEDRHGNRLSERFSMGCIKLTCPECSTDHYLCNMCAGDDQTPPGWYIGDSTKESIPCDNCNSAEVARQGRSI